MMVGNRATVSTPPGASPYLVGMDDTAQAGSSLPNLPLAQRGEVPPKAQRSIK
jgi:hypothetical protein